MYRPSLTTILSVAFLAYMAHSLWSIARLFLAPDCDPKAVTGKSCLTSFLAEHPKRSLLLFTTLSHQPNMDRDLKFLDVMQVENPEKTYTQKVEVPLNRKVTRNGTLYLAVFTVPKLKTVEKLSDLWLGVISRPEVTYTMVPLTVYHIPEAETFNLIGDDKEKSQKKDKPKIQRENPVTHIRSKVTISMMTDNVRFPIKEIPPELYYLMRKTPNEKQYLPIVYIDELSLRLRDLVLVNNTDKTAAVEFSYKPISFGKMRLFLQFTAALSSMSQLGFTAKDTDEVKGIFADTNMVLLLVTFGVSAVHLLFDFLAFKNEINFWRKKKTMEGLSTTTVLWRAFSQSVIFLYLMDEETSLLVLIPSGIAAVIEMWKVTKAFKVSLEWSGIIPKLKLGTNKTENEKDTEAFDNQSMKYLSYLLYPLCIGGAIYSLLYTPHKSWYSWTIHSLVNGVYAFGFLFMLPQLFVNYKLKSVAHLPWRAFMYKAFNTFIDDLFAFIITMPTAHRVACFRDDVVFIIYLYQRYLYPVDKSRIDVSGMVDDDGGIAEIKDEQSKKKD